MPDRIPHKTLNNTLSIIMGGGRGSRLFPLTHKRSKPAVPLAGKYRLVDIPISNCLNSEIRQIYVLTQFNSESLNRHITDAYKFDQFGRSFVHVLAAQQTPGSGNWYQGTADAVRQNLSYFLERPYEYYLILSGDQLYRMDFRDMLAAHIANKAEVTIATTPVVRDDTEGFGIMDTDEEGRVTRFVEKPSDPEVIDSLRMPSNLLENAGLSGDDERFQASMGIYIFNRKTLQECLDNDKDDFGGDIIPSNIEKRSMFSYVFGDYWEDIGTIKAFYESNLDLTAAVPRYNFFDNENPIYSRARFLPASKINKSTIEKALVSDGCIISDAKITRCIIGLRSVIEEGCVINDSIIMGSDYYEKPCFDREGGVRGASVSIGAGSIIRKAIVDKNAIIGEGVIIDPGDYIDEDFEHAYVRDGIVVVPKSANIPPGTKVCEKPLPKKNV